MVIFVDDDGDDDGNVDDDDDDDGGGDGDGDDGGGGDGDDDDDGDEYDEGDLMMMPTTRIRNSCTAAHHQNYFYSHCISQATGFLQSFQQ